MTELPTGPQPWTAETIVDPALARSLIEAQFPELAPANIEAFGIGWDNTAYLVNDTWVFRFPRRTIAVPWIEQEAKVLPAIHERLPLPIPVPARVGHPTSRYAWPFAAYRMLPGVTACRADLSTDERAAIAAPLGSFLAALHSIRASEAESLGAGPDTIQRMDLEFRVPRAQDAIRQATERGLIADARPYLDVVEEVRQTRPPAALSLVHGDLYSRHLLIDEQRRLAGVIDWGDVHIGEPAVDLAIAFILLPPESRRTFFDAYGPIDPDVLARAHFRAVYHKAYVANYAHEIGEADLLRESRLALRWVARSTGSTEAGSESTT